MLKDMAKKVPGAVWLARKLRPFSSGGYWEKRYQNRGTSGTGSYGRLAEFKADILNRFVTDNEIQSVNEFGCGDGSQLELARYPQYRGYDVSKTIIQLCREKFKNDPSKSFQVLPQRDIPDAELTLSLDVIYHLVEDHVFTAYMKQLFGSSRRYVAIYSSNFDSADYPDHLRCRKFTEWVEQSAPQFKLIDYIPNRYPFDPADPNNTSFADFYFYERA